MDLNKHIAMRAVILCGLVVLTAARCETVYALNCETGQSCIPDDDTTRFNNDFAVAEPIGTLVDPATRQGSNIQINGELGKVLGKFDSADYFKFELPAGQFRATFTLSEQPPTTQWMMIYDENRVPLVSESQLRGHANEMVTLNLGAGGYYVGIFTDGSVAQNKNLKYVLGIETRDLPIPDAALGSCTGVQTFTDITGQRSFTGSVAGVMSKDAYAVLITHGTQFIAAPFQFPVNYDATLVSRTTGDRIAVVTSPSSGATFTAIDPGFYCLEVEPKVLPQSVNYAFNTGAAQLGFKPGTNMAQAPCVPMLNLGNLTQNGRYVNGVRQPQATDPSTGCILKPSVEYVLREWVSANPAEAWFRFDTNSPQVVELRVGGFYSPLQAQIVDSAGLLVGSAIQQGVSLTDQLPPLSLSIPVGAGRYYLRIRNVGAASLGTSFAVGLLSHPAP